MTPATLQSRLSQVLFRAVAPHFTGTAGDFAEQEIRFNEPGRTGNFSFYTRHYLREGLDFYSDETDTDQVLCFGTQTGKTVIMYCGLLFRMWQKARRSLFVKPSAKGTGGAENDARTRVMPMMRATAKLAALIPIGALRHNFKTSQQMLTNGSIADWTGSNSPANLAGNSYEDVYLDETEKFDSTRKRNKDGEAVEANAIALALKRTGQYRVPKRTLSSTPTLPSGRIWSALMQTDLRRRFVPCPLCGRDHPSSRLVVLAWSENYTVLPKTFGYGTPREPGSKIPLAFMKWDDEAKGENGWDFGRVERSAGFVCPHCGGRFHDDDKAWQDENGVWIPTKPGVPRTRGLQLPAMYSSNEENKAGKLAVAFLSSLTSIDGPQDFINSKLAEPYAGQDAAAARVEIVSPPEIKDGCTKIMTVDVQAVAPYFWFLIYAFGDSEIVALKGGPLETWDEGKNSVREVQLENEIPDAAVVIDSGWGAKKGQANPEVYRHCGQYGVVEEDEETGKLIHTGWLPAKGMPGDFKRRDEETGAYVPWYYRPTDLFQGTTDAGKVVGHVFEFAKDVYNSQLERLRHNKVDGLRYTIAPEIDTDEFHKHMRGHVFKDGVWVKRHRYAPDHMRSCAIMAIAFGTALGRLETNKPKETEKK